MVDFKKMADHSELRKEIEQAINKHSLENGSDTPDFILAEYLTDCLRMFDKAVNKREEWYGRKEPAKQNYDLDAVIEIAHKQGRRAILLERAIQELLGEL